MRRINLTLLLLAGGFYLLNRLVLQTITGGWLHWFLVCYANDMFAGLAIVAWTDLLLGLGRLPPHPLLEADSSSSACLRSGVGSAGRPVEIRCGF